MTSETETYCPRCGDPVRSQPHKALSGEVAMCTTSLFTQEWTCPSDGNEHGSESVGLHLVRFEWNTDYDGRRIDPGKEPYPETWHGPFATAEAAQTFAQDAFEDDTDVHDVTTGVINLASSPERTAALEWLRHMGDLGPRERELAEWSEALDSEGVLADYSRYDESRADLNEDLANLATAAVQIIRTLLGHTIKEAP